MLDLKNFTQMFYILIKFAEATQEKTIRGLNGAKKKDAVSVLGGKFQYEII